MDTHRGRRRLLALVTGALVAVPLALPARAASKQVIERGVQYVPTQVNVTVGDTVSWVFESAPPGAAGHTVTFNDRDLNPNCPPPLLSTTPPDCQRSPGDTVSRTFTTVGTFAYYCKIHRSQGMTGVVVVTAASSSTATSGSSSTTTTARASTTTTVRVTSSTTTTTRVLSTSSTVVKSSTTTSDTSSAVTPGAPPPLSGDDGGSNASNRSGGSGGGDKGTVALIVALLLVVSASGGFLLWRLRPGRA
jgi:plastocyanin